jgi:hypothetical protein
MAATDLVAQAKLIGFSAYPEQARCGIASFPSRVLRVAARITRITRGARRTARPGFAVVDLERW